MVQVAGKIARRIACWVGEGDEATQGHRFAGSVRFGSRLDVYLPPNLVPAVSIGTKVTAASPYSQETIDSGQVS